MQDFYLTVDVQGQFAENRNLRFEATNQEDSSFVRRNLKSTNYSVDAVLNWVLFDGTKMFITLDKLSAIRDQARWDAKVTIESTLSNILAAYFTVINEKSRLSILADALSLSKERLKIAEDKYKIGSFSKAEYLSAQVDYNADQSALIAQKGVLNDAKVQLNVLLARDASQTFNVKDSLIKLMAFLTSNSYEKNLSKKITN